MLTVGMLVTVTKGAREIWTTGRGSRYAPVKLRSKWRVSAIEDEKDGPGASVSLYNGFDRITMHTSARGKLARQEVTLNTGDPTKTIRIRLPVSAALGALALGDPD